MGGGLLLAVVVVQHQFALMDDQHPVADFLGFTQQVGGKQDGPALGQFADQLAEGDSLHGVKARGGLVQQQHLGVPAQRLRQANALAKAL